MRRRSIGASALAATLAMAMAAQAAAKDPADATTEYAHDAITVATPGRHAQVPTATCLVWANAEGLGMGPADLDGLHGVTLQINLHPLPTDGQPTSFAAGLAEAKARYPKAPAWIWTAIEKSRAAVEAGCAEDHEQPLKIRALSAKDRQG